MKSPSKQNLQEIKINAIISSEVKDYSNDPYFVKKGEASKAFLKKNGFPEELLQIRYLQSSGKMPINKD